MTSPPGRPVFYDEGARRFPAMVGAAKFGGARVGHGRTAGVERRRRRAAPTPGPAGTTRPPAQPRCTRPERRTVLAADPTTAGRAGCGAVQPCSRQRSLVAQQHNATEVAGSHARPAGVGDHIEQTIGTTPSPPSALRSSRLPGQRFSRLLDHRCPRLAVRRPLRSPRPRRPFRPRPCRRLPARPPCRLPARPCRRLRARPCRRLLGRRSRWPVQPALSPPPQARRDRPSREQPPSPRLRRPSRLPRWSAPLWPLVPPADAPHRPRARLQPAIPALAPVKQWCPPRPPPTRARPIEPPIAPLIPPIQRPPDRRNGHEYAPPGYSRALGSAGRQHVAGGLPAGAERRDDRTARGRARRSRRTAGGRTAGHLRRRTCEQHQRSVDTRPGRRAAHHRADLR